MPLDIPSSGQPGHLNDHGALAEQYNIFEGSAPIYASSTPPSSPDADQLWYDTINDVTKRWNGSIWVFASRELAHVEKGDGNVDITTVFSFDQTGGVVIPSLSFDINAEHQMAVMARANLLVSGLNASSLEYGIAWIEQVRPDGSVVRGITSWAPITVRGTGAGVTGTNMMMKPEDRFVMPSGTNTFRIAMARFSTGATLRLNAGNYPAGSRAWLRAERMA